MRGLINQFKFDMRLAVLIVTSIIMLAAVKWVLDFGAAAQATYTFSVLRELEDDGLIKTNADALVSREPGSKLLKVGALRVAHLLVFVICMGWATIVCFVWWTAEKPESSDHKSDG